MEFEKGQRVICVDDDPHLDPEREPSIHSRSQPPPVRGQVYTVEDFFEVSNGARWVTLKELTNPGHLCVFSKLALPSGRLMTETTQLKLALLCVILAMAIWALPALHLLMGVAVGYVLMGVGLGLVAAGLWERSDSWRSRGKDEMTTTSRSRG